MLLSDNGVSKVWVDDEWVYKRQPKFMTDNEIWCLETMFDSGFVPYAEQVDIETIRSEYIRDEEITNIYLFRDLWDKVPLALLSRGIRHGDLTAKAVLINNNRPYLIDFAESRLIWDPRPDKRKEGDAYWLALTLKKLEERKWKGTEQEKSSSADLKTD